MASKQWQALEAEILPRMNELLTEGCAAALRGETTMPHRWAFVEALKWRDDSDLRRNSLQWRFVDAIIERMCADWAKELN